MGVIDVRAYHFLSSHNAMSDLALRRIRISRYADLNDPFELLAANLREPRIREAITHLKNELHTSTGLLCFCQGCEDPVLWSHYASKHRGVCLGFELNDKLPTEINYSPERLAPEFEPDDPTNFTEAFVRELLRTKFEHWRYEDEIRVFVGLDLATVEDGSYFQPFSNDIALREVILGALCALPVDAMRAFVRTAYGDEVKVYKAALAYKSYRVVIDKNYEAIKAGQVDTDTSASYTTAGAMRSS